MQPKLSIHELLVVPAHLGNSLLHPTLLAWLLRPLHSVALARGEIPLGCWMEERSWMIASWSRDKGERDRQTEREREREREIKLKCSLFMEPE